MVPTEDILSEIAKERKNKKITERKIATLFSQRQKNKKYMKSSISETNAWNYELFDSRGMKNVMNRCHGHLKKRMKRKMEFTPIGNS